MTQLNTSIEEIINQFDSDKIALERKEDLDAIANSLNRSISASEKSTALIFICTHNSRRSQFAQVWSHTLSKYMNLPIVSYSGGVEVTEVAEGVTNALSNQGFLLENKDSSSQWEVNYGDSNATLSLSSKLYQDDSNPSEAFHAIMVCSDADEGCPVVFGATARYSLPYEDPKRSDGTENQSNVYEATSLIIANELNYLFSQLKVK